MRRRRKSLGVERGAGETGSASSQVLSAAQMLSGDSNRLKIEVAKFLGSVRAAYYITLRRHIYPRHHFCFWHSSDLRGGLMMSVH